VTLLSLQIFSPRKSGAVISDFVSARVGVSAGIDVSFIGSVIWFCLLGLVVRYFQTVVHVERQYSYIHGLEEQLGSHYDYKAFTREGRAYFNDYPTFSTWAWILYTIIFPVLLLVVVFVKIVNEFRSTEPVTSLFIFNATVFLCIIVSTLLYLTSVHFRKKSNPD
jgi:magnesium-transporting ATPase (P-type)